MRPLTIMTFSLLSASLSLCSCSGVAPLASDTVKEKTSILAELCGMEPGARSFIDESTLDNRYIDVLWESTDTLGVFGSTTGNAMFLTEENRTASATFSGEMNQGDAPAAVYYPYTPLNDGLDPASLKGTLPLVQDYWQLHPGVDNDWRIGRPTESKGVFTFTHLFTTLHFRLQASQEDLAGQKLESITLTVTGADGTKRQLGGDFTFSLTDGFKSFSSNPSNSNVIMMRWRDCPELVAGNTFHGFITCAPNVKQGDNIRIEIRTTTKITTVERTSLTDFESNTGYTIPLRLSDFTDKTIEDRTDVDSEAMHHPSMLLRHEDLARIHHAVRTNPAIAAMHRHTLSLCEKYLTMNCVTNNASASQRWTTSGGESGAEMAAEIVMNCAYAYRMTLDDRYAQRAIKEMVSLSDMSTWSGNQFLDAAEVEAGVALGYDWLYERMTDDQRNKVRFALYGKGLTGVTTSSEVYRRTTNWNSVCNGGAVVAGLALRNVSDTYQGYYNTAYTRAKNYNGNVLAAAYKDGMAYPEGPAYWGYGTNYQVLMFQALEDALGTTSSWTDILGTNADGFYSSAKFYQMCCGPSGRVFNFSDGRVIRSFEPSVFWFASHQNAPYLAYNEIQAMKKGEVPGYPHQFMAMFISLASRIDFNNVPDPGVNYWLSNSSADTQPIFVYRSDWNSENAAYLAVKGGKAGNTHGHMDAGSFVYDINGERWAFDLGGQAYSKYEATGNGDLWKYDNGSGRWSIFRLKNSSHNTVTINGQEHLYNGTATITSSFRIAEKKGCVVNMTGALGYPANAKVQSALRTIYVDGEDILHIEDAITAGTTAANVTWTMITDATPTVSGQTITLTKNGKTMELAVVGSTNASAFTADCNTGLKSYDEENPGMYKVGFTYTISANSSQTLHVRLSGK